MVVDGAEVWAGVAPTDDEAREPFHTVWVGSYLDEAPATRAAESLRALGLLAFTVKKTLAVKSTKASLGSEKIGEYNLVCAGLFGTLKEAQILGRRLMAQGIAPNWRAIGAADPGERAKAAIQVAPLVDQAARVTKTAYDRAGRPLPVTAPAATGAGFKRLVHGQYVSSHRDYIEAKEEARRLTAAGWPAAVERAVPSGGNWFRVYLTDPTDRRDFAASPRRLTAAKAERQVMGGLIFLVDLSGQSGKWGQIAPGEARLEASACAGYSRPGRTLTGIERVIGQIPTDSPVMMAVKSVTYAPPDGLVDKLTRPFRTWWKEDESELTAAKSAYGPTIFNRPQVTKAIRNLTLDPKAVSMAPAFDGLYEAREVPGPMALVLWSDFRWEGPDTEILAAAGRLKAQFGGRLDLIVVWGDPDDKGLKLAESLAKSEKGGAYDGCRLLADQGYFQGFIGRILSRAS
jgi:hypothetical protein